MTARGVTSQAVRRLGEVMEEAEIDTTGVARILSKDAKTVRRWLASEAAPRWEVKETVLALNVVLERLADVVEPGSAEEWLFTPVPALENRRPVDLIRDGHYREVLDLIDAMGEGVFT
jgi:putative toxin-antitoxin system antitoxin component (TIGR02293 family)